MALTLSKQQEHDFTISKAQVCYWLSTLACSVDEAKGHFANKYGGYLKFLEKACSSGQSRGAAVLVHIIFSREKETSWLNMAIFPIDSYPQKYDIKPILPVELLSEVEKQQQGGGFTRKASGSSHH
jgi:hypothetical protein